MTTQCDPSRLQIIGTDEIEHFYLPQCHIRSLPEGEPSEHLDPYVVSINVAESAEFIKSKFVRLSRVSIPDFKGPRLKALRKLCEAAHPSEEFFVTIARNQWLRTTIRDKKSGDLFTFTKRRQGNVIHSNVFPYESYWRRPQMDVGDESRSREHFPCHILKEADEQRQPLSRKLIEWRQENVSREECDITNHEQDDVSQQEDENIPQRGPSKKFWEVRDEVLTAKVARNGQISQVTWRGGAFIKKDAMNQADFDAEVKAMEKLCHPHIIYIFGINSCNGKQGSLYMELMEGDLLALILELSMRPDGGDKGPASLDKSPPFSHYNSVDILLQIAKAMAHMHRNGVIHGDVKTANILVSKFEISKNQHRYLAKVADFDSSQMKVSTGFRPALGTTDYAAPEVLKCRLDRHMVIPVRPEHIDVYSYGLVAFEVLTGLTMKHIYENKSRDEVKEGVMNGTLKPPLRAECGKEKFLCIDSLMTLIERCWDTGTSERPPQRPLFPEIVKVLKAVREQIPQEGAPEALHVEPAPPEALHVEPAPRALHVEPAPEALHVEPASEALHVEPASEALHVEPAPEALHVEPAPEALHVEPAPEALHVEPAPEALHVEPAAPAVHVEPAPRLEAGPGSEVQVRRRNRRGRTFKKLLRPFSCLSCVSGGNVQD